MQAIKDDGFQSLAVLSDTGDVVISGTLQAGDIKPSGSTGLKMLKLDGALAAKIHATGTAQFYSNVLADGNLTVAGTLFYKPYVAFKLSANAITQSTGQVPTASITTTRPNGLNGVYQFIFPAHPSGVEYLVIVQPITGSTGAAYYTNTVNAVSSTVFNVWCRTAANAIMDGNFFAYTVP